MMPTFWHIESGPLLFPSKPGPGRHEVAFFPNSKSILGSNGARSLTIYGIEGKTAAFLEFIPVLQNAKTLYAPR